MRLLLCTLAISAPALLAQTLVSVRGCDDSTGELVGAARAIQSAYSALPTSRHFYPVRWRDQSSRRCLILKPKEETSRKAACMQSIMVPRAGASPCFSRPVPLGVEDELFLRKLLEEASRLAPTIKDTVERIGLFGQIAASWTAAGDCQAAAKVFAEAVRLATTYEDEAERDGCLMTIAWQQAELGNIPEALHTVDLIKTRKDGALLQISGSAANAGQHKEARELANRIKDTSLRETALNGIANAQAQAGDVDGALVIAAQIKDPSRKDGALAMIALSRIEAGDIASAVRVGELITNAVLKSRILIEFAILQHKGGDPATAQVSLQSALQLLNDMPGDMAAMVAGAQAKVGDIAGALRTAKAIQDPLSRDATLGEISGLQAERIDIAVAMKSVDMIEDLTQRDIALKGVAIAQAKGKNFAGAMHTATSIGVQYLRASALEEIAKVQYKTCNKGAARRSLQQALEAAKTIEIGGGTNVIALWEVALLQAEMCDQDTARNTFRRAREAVQLYEDESYRATLLQDVAKAQAKAGQAQDAYVCAGQVSSPLVRAFSIMGIVQGMLERRR